MFCLKQYDTVLLTFDIKDLPLEGQKCIISAIYEENKVLDTARSSIVYHIGWIFSESELNRDTSVEFFDRSSEIELRPPMIL